MISNQRQYLITRSELRKFEASLEQLETKIVLLMDVNNLIKHQFYIDAVKSQIESFKEEIERYEQLKSGKVRQLNFDSLEKLPDALIQARIARGLSQNQLATLLGLKEQQIQQYESTRYAKASLSRIVAVESALNVKIKQEMIF